MSVEHIETLLIPAAQRLARAAMHGKPIDAGELAHAIIALIDAARVDHGYPPDLIREAMARAFAADLYVTTADDRRCREQIGEHAFLALRQLDRLTRLDPASIGVVRGAR